MCSAIFANQIYSNKKVLLLYTGLGPKGGTRSYKLSLYKGLLDHGFNVGFFIVNNKDVCEELDSLNLQYYKCDVPSEVGRDEYWKLIYQNLREICKREKIGIINCNTTTEVKWAKLLAKEFKLKVVLTVHVENKFAGSVLRGLDGILTVSPHIADQIRQSVKLNKLSIKNLEWTVPFFDAEKFLTFKSTRDKKTFFKDEFSIDILDAPIITMVANFLNNSKWKDHPTLLKALDELINKRHVNLQLMLAGEGPDLEIVKKLASKLKISERVHFLGRTNLIPELFFNSDIKVLASKSEAFGIVLLEASLMYCPLIGTMGTGMENVIKHNQTGLLFKKGDAIDLANKIEELLKSSKLRQKLAKKSFEFVYNNFLPEVGVEKIIKFYLRVLG